MPEKYLLLLIEQAYTPVWTMASYNLYS